MVGPLFSGGSTKEHSRWIPTTSRRRPKKGSVASNTTDRSSGPHKNWHGEVTTSCRTLIEDLIRLDVDEEEDEPTSPPDKISPPRRGGKSARGGPGVSKGFIQSLLRSAEARRRRKYEVYKEAVEKREADAEYIREKVERYKARREERFQRLLKSLYARSKLKDDVTNLLQTHSNIEEEKRHTVWKSWTDNIWKKIQRQCDHLLNRVDKNLEIHLSGSKSVTFSISDEPMVASVDVSSDPTKSSLYDTAVENKFRRSSQLTLSSGDPNVSVVHPMASTMLDSAHSEKYATECPSGDHLHSLARPSLIDPLSRQGSVLRKHRSRPVLEPMDWDPVRLKSTSCGQLARLSLPPGGERRHIRPLKRMDGFIDANEMQESAAGLRRTRDRHRDLGILLPGKPFVRKEGQSALYYNYHSLSGVQCLYHIRYKDMVTYASCGAPCQSHYHFPTSKASVDRELPLGKKIWKTPPGSVPFYLTHDRKKHRN